MDPGSRNGNNSGSAINILDPQHRLSQLTQKSSVPVVCTVPEEPDVFLAELLIDILQLVELLLEGAALVLLLAHLLLLLHQAGQGRHLSLKGQ